MNIDTIKEANKLLERINDCEYYVKYWRQVDKTRVTLYLKYTSDDIFNEFRNNIITDLEERKKVAEIDLENL